MDANPPGLHDPEPVIQWHRSQCRDDFLGEGIDQPSRRAAWQSNYHDPAAIVGEEANGVREIQI